MLRAYVSWLFARYTRARIWLFCTLHCIFAQICEHTSDDLNPASPYVSIYIYISISISVLFHVYIYVYVLCYSETLRFWYISSTLGHAGFLSSTVH